MSALALPPSLDALASAWRGPDLAARPERWTHALDPAEQGELARTMDALVTVPLASIRLEHAPLPVLAPRLARLRRELRDGLGFALLRGVPIEGRSEEAIARAHWAIGLHLGEPVPQNPQGELLCHVRDVGNDPRDPEVRLYTTRAEQDFHTDGADLIGLVCVRPARSGGLSRLVSSVRVFEALRASAPELALELMQPWPFRLPGAPDGAPRHFELPIVRWDGRHLSSFFIGWYIRRAQDLPDVGPLSARRLEALARYEALANDPALYLDMDFRPGDVQWLKNTVILHKRTAYEDSPDPSARRHLMRLWLAARDFPDGDDLLRDGMSSIRG